MASGCQFAFPIKVPPGWQHTLSITHIHRTEDNSSCMSHLYVSDEHIPSHTHTHTHTQPIHFTISVVRCNTWFVPCEEHLCESGFINRGSDYMWMLTVKRWLSTLAGSIFVAHASIALYIVYIVYYIVSLALTHTASPFSLPSPSLSLSCVLVFSPSPFSSNPSIYGFILSSSSLPFLLPLPSASSYP